MNVRDLIKELVEFDMDMEVEFEVGDDEVSDFELGEVGIHHRYVHFKLNVKGEELIDSIKAKQAQSPCPYTAPTFQPSLDMKRSH